MIETVPRSRGRLAHFGRAHPRTVDSLVAATLMVLSVPIIVDPSSGAIDAPLTVLFIVCVMVAAAAVAILRRHRPMLAFVVVFLATLPLGLDDPGLSNLAVAFPVFALAVYDSSRRAWIASGVSGIATLLLCGFHILFGIPTWDDIENDRIAAALSVALVGLLVLTVAALWGQNVGARKRYIDELIAHARDLERDREQQIQLATLAERSRIARDMHDIVAHSLSVVVRLADGADAVFDKEPDRARGAIRQLAGVARSSLTEMRRVVGMLDSGGGSLEALTGSGFDDLEALIEVYRGVGLPVTFDKNGSVPSEAGMQLAIFRVTQESLTNVLRHSTTPSFVSVAVVSDDDVTVTIRNDGVASGEQHNGVGRGIVGMRERAGLYGGRVDAGRNADGHWVVTMVLPGGGRWA